MEVYLQEITSEDLFENKEYECKLKLDRTNPISWLKTIAGFANASGGTMYIGVEDQSNKLIGFSREQADQERNVFNNGMNEHFNPIPDYTIMFLPYTIRDKERYILKIYVRKSKIRPVIVKIDGVPAIYMRREGYTNGATYEEIINMSISSQDSSFDVLPSDEKYDRSDFSKLQAFCRDHAQGKELTDKALMSIGFFDSHKILSKGAVLFRDDYSGGKTAVLCSAFSGKTKGSDRIASINRFAGNLTDSISFMYEFVMQRMNHSMIKHDTNHTMIEAFPRRALYEGIVNAIAHRDYFLDGTQIQIDLFQDRLEITSPGSFYRGEAFGKTYDLSSIMSKRRNEIVCGVLVGCEVMEASGTGFDKIMEDYQSADRRHRPFINAYSDHFTLTLPDLTYQEGIDEYHLPEIVYDPGERASAHDRKVLAYCYAQPRTTLEIAEMLQISNSTWFRKQILGKLEEGQYLVRKKQGRETHWVTNREKVFSV